MTLDEIKSITYGTAVYKTNKGNKLVYITQELGKDMVPYFAAGKKIIPLSKEEYKNFDDIFDFEGDDVDFTQKCVLSGEKFKNLPIKMLMPELEKKDEKLEKLLYKVMSIMKDEFPDIKTTYLNYRMPVLSVTSLDVDSEIAGCFCASCNTLSYKDEIYNYNQLETIFHETLHIASSKIEEDEESLKFIDMSGFDMPNRFGSGINEGITEMITEEIVGTNGAYPIERKFAKQLRALYNDDQKFYQKYFDADMSLFTDIFGDEDKAYRFITSVDLIQRIDDDVNFTIYSLEEEEIENAINYYIENKNMIREELTADEVDDLEFLGACNADEKFNYQFEKVSFVGDAEELLIDVFENKMKELDDDNRLKLVKEFSKYFIGVDEIERSDENHDYETRTISSEILDMKKIEEVDNRFINICTDYYSPKELDKIFDEAVVEQNKQIDDIEDKYVLDDQFDEYIESDLDESQIIVLE